MWRYLDLDNGNTFEKDFFFIEKFGNFINLCNDSREDIMKEVYQFAKVHGNIVTRVWLDEGNQIAEGSKKCKF